MTERELLANEKERINSEEFMAELKTKPTDVSVTDFLNAIKDEQVRQNCWAIAEIMQQATNAEPKMWGSGIVGCGNAHYKYPSGREGDWDASGLFPAQTEHHALSGRRFRGPR